jgi:hypothetical protein
MENNSKRQKMKGVFWYQGNENYCGFNDNLPKDNQPLENWTKYILYTVILTTIDSPAPN